MKKPSLFEFNIYRLLLLVFSFVFFSYWNSQMTDTGSDVGGYLGYARSLLAAFALYVWLSYGRTKWKGIHLVCLAWVLIWPILCWAQGERGVSIYIMPILCPLIYETTYLMVHHAPKRNLLIKNMFVLIAIYGLYLFATSRNEEFEQTNTIYFSFLTLPWLLYNSKRRMCLIILVLFTLLAMVSLKRSVMLSMVLCWGGYLFEMVKSTRRRVYLLVFVAALLYGVDYAFNVIDEQFGGRLSERVNREETDEGRNRLAIWEVTRDMIKESSADELIIGHGQYGVRRDSPLEISAHNDFLEVIYDYGLIIFVLYIFLWLHVVRRCYQLFKARSTLYLPYVVSLSIFIVMSMVSHLILYASYFNFLVMFWAATEISMHSKSKPIQSTQSKLNENTIYHSRLPFRQESHVG